VNTLHDDLNRNNERRPLEDLDEAAFEKLSDLERAEIVLKREKQIGDSVIGDYFRGIPPTSSLSSSLHFSLLPSSPFPFPFPFSFSLYH
jgi:hypothetical protein